MLLSFSKALRPIALISTIAALLTSSASADLWVDPVVGSDTVGTGTALMPFKTISHSLLVASAPEAIHLAPGDYKQSTGEVFPLMVPRGIDIIDDTGVQAAKIYGTGLLPLGTNVPIIEVVSIPGSAQTLNRFEGFGTVGGEWAVRFLHNGAAAGQIVMRDLEVIAASQGAAKFGLTDSPFFGFTISNVDLQSGNSHGNPTTPQNPFLIDAKGSSVEGAFDHCDIIGMSTGIHLNATSTNALGGSSIEVWMDNIALHNLVMAGLLCVTDSASYISTAQNHGLYYHIGYPLNPHHGGIVDDGFIRNIFHDVKQTIFNSNYTDIQEYTFPSRFTLALNVYHKQACFAGVPCTTTLPGGIYTSNPGFVGPGTDFHLKANAVAKDQGLAAQPDYVNGDLNGDHTGIYGLGCFDGMTDAGLDEQRVHSAYLRHDLRIGTTSTLRALGPVTGAGPLPVIAALYWSSGPAVSECPSSFELVGAPNFFSALNLDVNGIADFQIPVGNATSLVGVAVSYQVVFYDPNSQVLSYSRLCEETISR